MKKNITLWQMIVGLIICAVAMVSVFVPGIGLSSSKVAHSMADWSMEQADKLTFGLASGLLSEEMEKQEEAIASSVEEELTEKLGKDKISYSVFQLFLNSPKDIGIAPLKLGGYYNFLRIAFAVMLVLLVTIIVFTLLAWFGKVSRMLPVIFGWVCAIVDIALLVVLYGVVPSRLGKAIENGTDAILNGLDWLMGSDSLGLGGITDWLDMNVTSLFRSILWGMTDVGMFLWHGAVLLLAIWTILCLCIKSRAAAAEIEFSPYPAAAPGGSLYQGEMSAQGNTAGAGMATGIIRGVNGSMAGAEIVLQPGEQIVIGRDPSVCELILTDSKVSRKHCAVSFNTETGLYDVFCFSRNGMRLSDGRKIAPMQPVSIRPGIEIILAGGNEVIALD